MTDKETDVKKNISRKKLDIRSIILFAMLLSGAVTILIFLISLAAEVFLRDPLLISAEGHRLVPSWVFVRISCYIWFILFFFLYIPLKLGIQEQIITKKSGIVLVILLTYILSSISLAFFLSFTTEMIDYDRLLQENKYPEELKPYVREMINKKKCTFNLRESFFDAVSGFTTTGLTAFEKTGVKFNEKEEFSKIDAQPRLIHIIRATYLWIGGLGIMFFYLYFTPVPSLMMSMGYEITAERSLPKFVRLEGFSFSLVYAVITAFGILLLFFFISSACQSKGIEEADILTYSVVLTFSSISTGGFSPGSASVNELELGIVNRSLMINNWGLLVIMGLMLAGAMPIFTLHRPLKFFKRWRIFVVFLIPILGYSLLSYAKDPQLSFSRSFDAVSAFTTTGLYTTQFENDFDMPSGSDYANRHDREIVTKIYQYRLRCIYMIVLMFIGGSAYSTAGGWGFFSFFCSLYAIYLIITGKLERVLTKYILQLILSFIIFFSIFIVGTFFCYKSGLFGTFSGSDPAAIADYIINSAFYEISALSTVGLMPDSMLQDGGIYYYDLAYWTLAGSMLIGRLYYIIFPFLLSSGSEEEI